MNLKQIGKVFTSKFVGTGPSSYKTRIYRAAVSQRLRNTCKPTNAQSQNHNNVIIRQLLHVSASPAHRQGVHTMLKTY